MNENRFQKKKFFAYLDSANLSESNFFKQSYKIENLSLSQLDKKISVFLESRYESEYAAIRESVRISKSRNLLRSSQYNF